MNGKTLSLIFFTFFVSNTVLAQPNILLVIADDLGIDVLNGYQNNARMPATPTIDSLREKGVTFTNTWATPQCTSSRAAIMSGKFGIKTGVMRPPGNLDLEHESVFKRIGENTNNAYADALIGKWHISNPVNYEHPGQHGIDHYEGLFSSGVEDYYTWEKIENETPVTVNEYVTTHLTNAAINWIDEQTGPWFLWLAHAAPHAPYHVPPSGLFNQTNTSNNLGKYLAAVEAMDHEIGRLLGSMDSETLANTVVIFVGDNGTPSNVIQNFPTDHAKATLYEGGVRVPLIISGKGVSRMNEQEDNINHISDLYATILAFTGEELEGGIYNSRSLKPLLSAETDFERSYVYTDYQDGSVQGWAIRDNDYKLIQDEDGRKEFYKISEDILEEINLIGELSAAEESIVSAMELEAESIRSGWSCNDGILNGDEASLDDCSQAVCNVIDGPLSADNIACCDTPDHPSIYYEYFVEGQRRVYTNNFPDHDYCYNSTNQIPDPVFHDFGVDLNPTFASETTHILHDTGRPARYFGVAKNGVIFAPAPAAPFIFEDLNTGEYNLEWVFEPTNNIGRGADKVGLDCASAHTGGQGYHYHGNMFSYVDNEVANISSTTQAPTEPLHVGWAADGFPIVYRFGPDAAGVIRELFPGYQIKSGQRPGDGISAPCGPHNGKYTNDYEYVATVGDLDECNGIQSNITIETANGNQVFNYYYVITSSFPQIPRCLKGNVSADFDNSNDPLTGIDMDMDGFLSTYDCDDDDPTLNPLTVDGNCEKVLGSSNLLADDIRFIPNPANSGSGFIIKLPSNEFVTVNIVSLTGRQIKSLRGSREISCKNLKTGIYIVALTTDDGVSVYKKQIVK